jgi:hypothetical protein
MNSTVTSSSLGAPRISRLKLWAGVVAAAMAATAVQIAFYGAPSFFGFGAYHVASGWVTAAALAWAVGPALLALVAGLWRVAAFRRFRHRRCHPVSSCERIPRGFCRFQHVGHIVQVGEVVRAGRTGQRVPHNPALELTARTRPQLNAHR